MSDMSACIHCGGSRAALRLDRSQRSNGAACERLAPHHSFRTVRQALLPPAPDAEALYCGSHAARAPARAGWRTPPPRRPIENLARAFRCATCVRTRRRRSKST